uniref:Immunoglobulin domain-containing protein n=1 Tax=Terrapene triunguis TaxID=2587831 RepID=A0A674IBQ1_9SAUR
MKFPVCFITFEVVFEKDRQPHYKMTLGSVVTFHLGYPDFEHPAQIIWKKGNTLLYNGTYRMNRFTVFSNGTSYEQFPNGTLKIDRLVEEDSGNYKVTVYNGTGSLQVEKNLILSVQGESSSMSLPP